MSETRKAALLVGAGDAIGAAVARRFAAGGYAVCIARREPSKSQALVEEIKAAGARGASLCRRRAQGSRACSRFASRSNRDVGPIEVCLFNAGSNVNKPLLETTERLFFKAWELACFAGFLVGREATRCMLPAGRGTMLFTGATASVRGGSGFAAFAAAKFGLARGSAVHGAGAWTEEYPRRAPADRCRRGQPGDPQRMKAPAASTPPTFRRQPDADRLDRGSLLVRASADTRWLDP